MSRRDTRPLLLMRLTVPQCSVLARYIDVALDRVEARELADPRRRGIVEISGASFIERVKDVGYLKRISPKSLSFTFGPNMFPDFHRHNHRSLDEARVLRLTIATALAGATYIHPSVANALHRHLRAMDAWLGVSIVDRLATIDGQGMTTP